MTKFRKKSVVIDAKQFSGANADAVVEWAQGGWKTVGIWLKQENADTKNNRFVLVIPTLEGEMEASPGDYIIRGIMGELYPCKPDIFDATYERVE